MIKENDDKRERKMTKKMRENEENGKRGKK